MRLSDLYPDLKEKTKTKAKGVGMDSRAITRGDIFVAVKGHDADGHDHIDDAIAKGAVAVVAQTKPKAGKPVPVITRKDTRAELARLARIFFPAQPGMLVGVTGTNGKTSTIEFLRQIWEHIGWRGASIGTLGVVAESAGRDPENGFTMPALTTPDAVGLHRLLDNLARAGITHAAMEASSHGLDQGRLDGVQMSVAGFTNLTHEHLDYHDSMDSYFAAKSLLFTRLLAEGGVAVINTDSDWGKRLAEATAKRALRIITIGTGTDKNNKADIVINATEPYSGGMAVEISCGGNTHSLNLALGGAFQAANAVLAAALAHASGALLEHAILCLPYLRAAPGRMQTIHGHPRGAMVVVDYAHSPDALANALGSLRPAARGQLGVVFGCGGDRDKAKRPQMGRIAAELADFVIVTDDNPRGENPASIRAEIITACPGAIETGDRHQAIFDGIDRLDGGDVLLIAGKGHESTQMIGTETLPFSDEATIRGILAGLANGNTTAGQGGAA